MLKQVSKLFCAVVLSSGCFAAQPNESEWVKKRIAELQPSQTEKRFDEIGWAADIRDAKHLARLHRRPVFLFTHDGRINIGRC